MLTQEGKQGSQRVPGAALGGCCAGYGRGAVTDGAQPSQTGPEERGAVRFPGR